MRSVLPFLLLVLHTEGQEINNLDLNSINGRIYQTGCGAMTYFRVKAVDPCLDLNITVIPSNGEPDIYVSREINGVYSYPTPSSLSWAAFADGVYSLAISHWDPNYSPGYFDIGVFNDCSHQSETAKYKIYAMSTSNPSDASDIFLHPEYSTNQLIHVPDYKTEAEYYQSVNGWNTYKFYRFCVPTCADVIITIDNCRDASCSPTGYSYPELIVSRTDPTPRFLDYSWKLIYLNYITINHTDPSARDLNGYLPGSFYVSVFGWCTPDDYVVNWATDGPCLYAANVTYNVTVEILPLPSSACPAVAKVLPPYSTPVDNMYVELKSNVLTRGFVACGDYFYYYINVPSPCNNLQITIAPVHGPGNPSNVSIAEIAVGKWPNVRPVLEGDPTWSSIQWEKQNLTIGAWDPEFNGGYTCGPNSNELCQIIIGVTGYCTSQFDTQVNYAIKATLGPVHAIYNTPQVDQKIAPLAINSYKFCVPVPSNTLATLYSWTDACSCPDAYANLEMVVSKYNANATISSYAWRLGHGETGRNSIALAASDRNTRAGTYFLNVIGWCNNVDECSNNCTCAPCSNLKATKYALLVAPTTTAAPTTKPTAIVTVPSLLSPTKPPTSAPSLSKVAPLLPDCPQVVKNSCSGSSTCSAPATGLPLSAGAIAGVVIAGLFFIVSSYVSLYWCFCRGKEKTSRGGEAEMQAIATQEPDQI